MFGYRFVYPAMRVGRHEVYWHRPLVAWLAETGQPAVLPDAPLGYLTAYEADDRATWTSAVELWPRLLRRDLPSGGRRDAAIERTPHAHQTARSIRKLSDAWELLGEKPLPRSFARSLLAVPQTHDARGLAGRAARGGRRRRGRRARGRAGAGPARTRRGAAAARPRRPHARFADLRPHGHAPLRGDLLEDHRLSRGGPISQQEQRRLRPRRRHATPAGATTPATWTPWAITCWPTTRRRSPRPA